MEKSFIHGVHGILVLLFIFFIAICEILDGYAFLFYNNYKVARDDFKMFKLALSQIFSHLITLTNAIPIRA